MSLLVNQGQIKFASSGAPDIVAFRVYYLPAVAPDPQSSPQIKPFEYTDPYFTYTGPVPENHGEYLVPLDITDPFEGNMRIRVVEEDAVGNLSDFSQEIIVPFDQVAPAGVTNLQYVPPAGQ